MSFSERSYGATPDIDGTVHFSLRVRSNGTSNPIEDTIRELVW